MEIWFCQKKKLQMKWGGFKVWTRHLKLWTLISKLGSELVVRKLKECFQGQSHRFLRNGLYNKTEWYTGSGSSKSGKYCLCCIQQPDLTTTIYSQTKIKMVSSTKASSVQWSIKTKSRIQTFKGETGCLMNLTQTRTDSWTVRNSQRQWIPQRLIWSQNPNE